MLDRLFRRSAPAEPPTSPVLRDGERQAVRTTLVDELRRAEEQLVEELGAIGFPRASARCEELLERLRAAQVEASHAQFADFQARSAFDRERSRLETEIATLADPRIDAFLDSLQHDLDTLSNRIVRTEGLSARDPRTGHR